MKSASNFSWANLIRVLVHVNVYRFAENVYGLLPERQGTTATVSRRRSSLLLELVFSRRGAGAQRVFFKTIHAAGDSGSHDLL